MRSDECQGRLRCERRQLHWRKRRRGWLRCWRGPRLRREHLEIVPAAADTEVRSVAVISATIRTANGHGLLLNPISPDSNSRDQFAETQLVAVADRLRLAWR